MVQSTLKKYSIILILFTFTFVSAETIGRVIKANGTVLIKPIGGGTYSVNVKPGQAVSNGDAIRVGESSFAVVIFLDDKSIVKARENTDFQFVETSNTRSLIIEQGTTLHNVNSKDRKKAYRVETPVSVASVKGTEFSAFHDAIAGVDKFVGKTGNFEVFNTISGMTINVGAGQKAVSNSLGQLIPAPAQPGDYPEDPDGESSEEQQEEQDEQDEPEESQDKQDQEETQGDTKTEDENIDQDAEPDDISDPSDTQVDDPKSGDTAKPEPKPKKPFNLGLGVGSATIDGKIYNQVALRPELSFGKLGLGLDLVLYIDNEGNVRQDEWDEASDVFDKFLYIRWGQKSDPFWFKWGALSNVTLGYGGLLGGYSNMMEFPSVRKVGIHSGVRFGNFGTELFLSNMKDFSRGGTLMGLRGTYKVSDALPITLGLNFIMDMNQFSGLKDADDDTYPDMFDDFPDDKNYWNDTDGDGIADFNGGSKEPENGWDIDGDGDNILDSADSDLTLKPTPFSLKDNKATAQGFAFDLGYPILKSKAFSLEAYMEYNKLIFPKVKGDAYYSRKAMNGTGITVPGVRASLFSFLNVSFEYRMKQGYFAPQFFDGSYDLSRVVAEFSDTGTVIKTKDQVILVDSSNTSGMYGSASANLFNFVSFNAAYASMKGDGDVEYNSFSAMINVNAENIPKLSVAQAYYQRNNDKNPFDFKNPTMNTIFGYKVGYEVSAGVSLIWDFRQFYRDTGAGLEPVKQTTIETAFNF
jgi:hypothetical protein